MKKRMLGSLDVPAIGLGCMVMPGFYLPGSEEQSLATLRRAAEIGAGFLDTSDMYGNGANETLLARALKGRRDDGTMEVDGRPEYVAAACENSLKRLGIEYVDL